MYGSFKYSEAYTLHNKTASASAGKEYLVIIVGHRYRVRVQVVACSKGYLHITVMLSKVYGPESQLPLPALVDGL